jgi:polysaccharide pyruvyl transferase WcaK-like protein
MLELSNYDAVVGARYHGVALGVQSEVPGILIAIDSRTYELGKATGIPTVKPVDLLSVTKNTLKRIWEEFDPFLYDSRRVTLAQEFLNFLKKNGLEPTDHLKRIAESN